MKRRIDTAPIRFDSAPAKVRKKRAPGEVGNGYLLVRATHDAFLDSQWTFEVQSRTKEAMAAALAAGFW